AETLRRTIVSVTCMQFERTLRQAAGSAAMDAEADGNGCIRRSVELHHGQALPRTTAAAEVRVHPLHIDADAVIGEQGPIHGDGDALRRRIAAMEGGAELLAGQPTIHE